MFTQNEKVEQLAANTLTITARRIRKSAPTPGSGCPVNRAFSEPRADRDEHQ